MVDDEIFIDDFSDEEIEMVRGFAKELLDNYNNNRLDALQDFEIHNAETIIHYFPNNEAKQIDLFLALYCTMVTSEKNTGQMIMVDQEFTKYFYDKFDVRWVLDKEIALIKERKEAEVELKEIYKEIDTKWFELIEHLGKALDEEEKGKKDGL